jgi:hypothetical protein
VTSSRVRREPASVADLSYGDRKSKNEAGKQHGTGGILRSGAVFVKSVARVTFAAGPSGRAAAAPRDVRRERIPQPFALLLREVRLIHRRGAA